MSQLWDAWLEIRLVFRQPLASLLACRFVGWSPTLITELEDPPKRG